MTKENRKGKLNRDIWMQILEEDAMKNGGQWMDDKVGQSYVTFYPKQNKKMGA